MMGSLRVLHAAGSLLAVVAAAGQIAAATSGATLVVELFEYTD